MTDQRTPAWFAMRAGKFTGSRFADLMAVTKSGPSTSRANLIATLAVERITGACVETYSNGAMQRGTELEPEARSAYETHCGDLVDEVAFVQHPTLPLLACHPMAWSEPMALSKSSVRARWRNTCPRFALATTRRSTAGSCRASFG